MLCLNFRQGVFFCARILGQWLWENIDNGNHNDHNVSKIKYSRKYLRETVIIY